MSLDPGAELRAEWETLLSRSIYPRPTSTGRRPFLLHLVFNDALLEPFSQAIYNRGYGPFKRAIATAEIEFIFRSSNLRMTVSVETFTTAVWYREMFIR